MSREIKFRAWDPLTKTMIAAGYHVIGEVTMFQIIEQWVYEHPDGERSALERMGDIIEMHWTGLVTKDKKDIYESDIVEAWSEGYKGIFEVRWRQEGSPRFILYPAWQQGKMWSLHGSKGKDGAFYDDVKILGNIHQNPKLLNL